MWISTESCCSWCWCVGVLVLLLLGLVVTGSCCYWCWCVDVLVLLLFGLVVTGFFFSLFYVSLVVGDSSVCHFFPHEMITVSQVCVYTEGVQCNSS